MEERRMQQVRELLAQAGSAHHDFEVNDLLGARDEEWPAWYAGYCMAHGLRDLIGREMSEEELAGLLQACDADYRREQPPSEWPDYYARRILWETGREGGAEWPE